MAIASAARACLFASLKVDHNPYIFTQLMIEGRDYYGCIYCRLIPSANPQSVDGMSGKEHVVLSQR
jgi:hypothetical protein